MGPLSEAPGDTDTLAVGAKVFRWSPWVDFERVLAEPLLPLSPGLYRLRRHGRTDLDYIGQTGGPLRGRVRMLRGVLGVEMPYRDPHTAGPALWAIRQASQCSFEVSVVEVDAEPAWRKGLEAVAISFYRQRRGQSPTFNFGRMPAGYAISSGRNARLAAAGRQFRGGPSSRAAAQHEAGIPPVAPLDGDLQGPRWCGHDWNAWLPLEDVTSVPPASAALYRLRNAAQAGLTYVGEGLLATRVRQHRRTARTGAGAHGAAFLAAAPLEVSYVRNDSWLGHQRHELENDLIAAHMLELERPPLAQFAS